MTGQRIHAARPLIIVLASALLGIFTEPSRAQVDATTRTTSGDGVTVLDLISFHGKLYLPASVNGHAGGVMCLDTGSAESGIHHHDAAKLDVHPVAQKALDTFEGTKEEGLAFLDQLDAGPLRLRNAPVFVCDCNEPPLKSGQEVVGEIGMDVLGKQPFAIDFRAHTLTIYEQSRFAPPSSEALPLRPDATTPRVRASIEGHEGWFEIDTGYSDMVLLSRPFVELNLGLVLDRPQVRPKQNWNERSNRYDVRWKSAEILGSHLPELFGSFDGDDRFGRRTAGLIGLGILRERVLTVDWESKEAWCRELPPEPLDELVARLRDKSHQDLSNRPPLYQAARLARPDAVKRLLELGERPDDTDDQEITALMMAAALDQGAIVDTLISHGASPDARCTADRFTPLLFAAEFGRTDASKRLLDAGAKVNLASFSGRTALFLAAEGGYLDLVNLLLERGAKVDRPLLATGETPLLAACNNGNLEVAKVLIAHGASAKATGERGTCLSYAADHPSPGCVRLLLAHGADPNRYAKLGMTPLMNAASIYSAEAAECVKLLLAAGADPSIKTVPDGKTAYDMAIERGHVESIKLLRPKSEKPSTNPAN